MLPPHCADHPVTLEDLIILGWEWSLKYVGNKLTSWDFALLGKRNEGAPGATGQVSCLKVQQTRKRAFHDWKHTCNGRNDPFTVLILLSYEHSKVWKVFLT